MTPVETVKGWAGRSKQFYGDVRGEMRKVTWPSRQEVTGTTIVVIAAVFFFGTYLWLVDVVLKQSLAWVFRYFGVA